MNIYQNDFAQMIKDGDYEGIKALIISKFPMFLTALAILVIGFIVADFIGKVVVKALILKGVDSSIHTFIKTIAVITVKFAVLITALSKININVNSFVTAIGAAGVTAGIGLQQSIAQMASGIQILINHPFKSGDYVEIDSVSGTVQEIQMMYTVLLTLDNKRVTVPNSKITAGNIVNYTAQEDRRIDLVYSISYNTDINKARECLKSVARRCEYVLDSPEPIIAVLEHAASSVNLACYVWCKTSDYWQTFYYMQEAVKVEFDKCGIEIPFSQVDVHIK
ncbi:MAG: mechanosensitive ion channel [Clostridiales bacterium]|nr:mechanosensitive ion channel [Clostridiales bacterium]